MSSVSFARIYPEVVAAGRSAADYIRSEFGHITALHSTEKSRNSLVSTVDQHAERLLVDALSSLLPEAAFVCEESTVAPDASARYQWVVDPLDGTTNFLYGLPHFAVSIGLREEGQTRLGVVVDVMNGCVFGSYAGCDQVLVDKQPIPALTDISLEKALLATGFAYNDFGRLPAQLQIIDQLLRRSRGVRRMGAAALDLAYLAAGRFHGFFEYALEPYDVCAGAFLVQQAGGRVTDFGGGGAYTSGATIVAGVPSVHAELLQLIDAAGLGSPTGCRQ